MWSSAKSPRVPRLSRVLRYDFGLSRLRWNHCPACLGITVQLRLESVSSLRRNSQPLLGVAQKSARKVSNSAHNEEVLVDTESMLVLVPHISQDTNDKQQVTPMVKKMQANPEGLNQPNTLLADTGYFSEKNAETCIEAKITPLIAVKRDEHHPKWRDRFTEPDVLAEDASSVDAMKHALKTNHGRAVYALRKQTVEPVFGIIKSVMGFRQFLLRGLKNVQNEWTLVCLAWNLIPVSDHR